MPESRQGTSIDWPLFSNAEKKTVKQPDFRGDIEMSKAMLKEMVDAVKEGKPVHLQVAGWKNEAKSGLKYIGCKLSVNYWKMDKPDAGQARSAPTTTSAPADDDPFDLSSTSEEESEEDSDIFA